MTTTKGKDGRFKVAGVTVAETRSFQFTRRAANTDSSTLEDEWDDHEVTTKDWDGSAEVFWDPSDANGQGALEEGMVAHVYLYPQGTSAGKTYWHGDVSVGSVDIKNTRDGLVEASIQFKGKGACTKSVVGS